jgi:hypothetical protein
VKLAGIVAGVLLAVGGLVVLAGTGLHAWVAGHRYLAENAARTAGALPGRLAGRHRGRQEPGPGTGSHALALTLTFAADGDGTVMGWDWQMRPKGWMRMPGPLFGPLGGRMERRIWTSMKRYLKNTAARPVTQPAP